MRPFYLLLALLPVALALPAPQDGPVRDTQCTCPPPECPQEEPAGCECRNQAILDCSDQKQAAGLTCPVPALAACPKQPDTENPAPPPPRKEKPPPAVKPNPDFKCPCDEIYCVQSFPDSCECANRHARECYDNCGGPEPVYDNRCGFGDDTPPPQTNPYNTPGPVIPPGFLPPDLLPPDLPPDIPPSVLKPPELLPPGENNPPAPPPSDCDTITDHDERKQCKEDAKQRKGEEKAQRKQGKEDRKRRKDDEKNACGDGPPCKEGEECVDIIFDKVRGESETKKGCLPEKESEG